MHKLEQHIESSWSHLRSNTISVACSGGLDSIVLASVLNKLRFKVEVIHVNYQLRGEDSEKDAAFVEQFCLENCIPFQKRIIDLNSQLKDGGNLQELARNARYDWFKEILKTDSNSKVALAHHLNDQVETFFLNLGRKSGVMGLACMQSENNGIIRPLLDFSKEELQLYAEEFNIRWREDISNESSKYKRNMLRNIILPEIVESIPTLNESVITLVKQFQQKQKELEIEVRLLYNQILNDSVLSVNMRDELSELAFIELFRELNQPSGIALEVKNLNKKGTKVELLASDNHSFTEVVFDGNQLSFITDEVTEIPEFIVEDVSTLPTTFSKEVIYLDTSKIKGELRLRKWEIGDRIAPVGMKGTQLISDVITDAKLNSFEKAKVLVLCDDDNIHWCVGMKVGRLAVAQKSSDDILKCQLG